MATTANLQARLGMDDSDFSRVLRESVNKANRAAKEMQETFSTVGKALAGVFTIGAVVEAGRGVIEFASHIQDMSDSVNLSAETFQRWTAALEQSGGKQEDLVKGLSSLQNKIQDARDGTEKSIKSFERLGIGWEQLHTLSVEEIFLKVSDALKSGRGDLETFSSAQDLFGTKVAIKLIPALQQGSKAFLELANSATAASNAEIAALDDLGDKAAAMLTRLKTKAAIGGAEFLTEFTKAQDFATAHVSGGEYAKQWKAGLFASLRTGLEFAGIAPLTNDKVQVTDVEKEAFRREMEMRRKMRENMPDKPLGEEAKKENSEELAHEVELQTKLEEIAAQTAEIYRGIYLDNLTPAERIAALEREKLDLLKLQKIYENDIFQLHQKDAAETGKKLAQNAQQLQKLLHGDLNQGNLGRTNFEDRAMSMREAAISKANNPNSPSGRLAFDSLDGGLQTGGLSLGGLNSGGLHGQGYGLVRAGDAARAKAAAAAAKDPLLKAVEDQTKAINRPAYLDD